jgi:hypothetical protein
MTEATMRQEFLDAASDIREAFEACSGEMGLAGRGLVRAAYARLVELGSQIPGVPAGSPLSWGGMEDKDVATAVRQAEKGYASPAVILELTREMRRLRAELRAFGGPSGVTEEAIRSMIAEGFHTALRKAADSMDAAIAWKAIRDMDSEEYSAVCRFVSEPVIGMLREAETRTAAGLGQAQEQEEAQ